MKKKLLIVIGLLVVVFAVYKYTYQKHRDISSETEVFNDSATVLKQNFNQDVNESTTKYLNNTVVVFGVISDVESNAITIDGNAYCLFDEKVIGLNIGEQIKIKGRCIGYDELLEVVKVDQSVILK